MHRAPTLRLYPGEIIVDNFAGGGGASLGIELALGRSPDIAINHDAQAVAMHAATSRERFGLVSVHNEPYAIVDIGMRMLAPRELYRAQGFPDSYRIDIEIDGKRMPKDAQVRMCGNSVCPPMAAAMVRAQFAEQLEQVAA